MNPLFDPIMLPVWILIGGLFTGMWITGYLYIKEQRTLAQEGNANE